MADWTRYRITPLDLPGSFQEGYKTGKLNMAGRTAASGDYRRAAAEAMPYDMGAAKGYLQLGDYEDKRAEVADEKAFAKRIGGAIASGDRKQIETARNDAFTAGRLDQGQQIGAILKKMTDDQLEQTRQTYGQMYADMNMLDALEGAERQTRYDEIKGEYARRGLDVSRFPPSWGPNVSRAYRAQVFGAEKALEMELEERKIVAQELNAQSGARRADSSETLAQAAMIRANRASEGAETNIIGPEEAAAMGLPAGTYFLKQGQAPKRLDREPRPPMESERLAAGFAARMDSAVAAIDRLTRTGKVDWATVYAPDYLAGNANAETKEVRRAVRDFINAQLRRESGAAIGANEFASARLQYVPAPNDPPQVVGAKLKALEQARDIMRQQGGIAYESLAGAAAPGAADDVPEFIRDAKGNIIPNPAKQR